MDSIQDKKPLRRSIPKIKLYGTKGCHKTQYYQLVLDDMGLPYEFLDVEGNAEHAAELRSLYINGKLNYPTITIGSKKLRNPYKDELEQWINKLIPQQLELQHHAEAQKYSLDINGEEAKVEYQMRNGTMALIHSEVPHSLRGRGIGKELVLKTFEQLTEEGYKAIAVCSYIRAVRDRDPYWKHIIG